MSSEKLNLAHKKTYDGSLQRLIFSKMVNVIDLRRK